jgi:uncharacterized Tic20 family protein
MRRRILDAADRRVAALAHLGIGFGLVAGVGFLLGLAINVVIWLRSRSNPMVEFHAEQAGAYQLFVLTSHIVFAVLWAGGIVLLMGGSQVGEGLLSMRSLAMSGWLSLLGLEILWYFGSIFYGVYGGLKIALGGEFSYPVIGPWVERQLAKRVRKP